MLLRVEKFQQAYFSSLTGDVICRVKADKIIPARKRMGPFLMPAPGYELQKPSIEIFPRACTADDWAELGLHLGGLRFFTLRGPLTVRLIQTGQTTAPLPPPSSGAATSWQASGPPLPFATATQEPAAASLIFNATDAQGRRCKLRLGRDAASGLLSLQAIESRPRPVRRLSASPFFPSVNSQP
jgi:hypothetical protein